MLLNGNSAPSGVVTMRVLRNGSRSACPTRELSLFEIAKHGLPWFGVPFQVALWRLKNLPNLLRGLWKIATARALKIPHFYGQVSLVKIGPSGEETDYGLASLRVVTSAGVNYLVDALQGSTEPENLKYHGFGTGTNAEASGDTALQTELTTQYAVDSTRPTGSQTEGAANVYVTVATLSPDTGGTIAITEHGIFSATSAGTLLDRSVFSAVNLVAGSDSLQATYSFTITAGS